MATLTFINRKDSKNVGSLGSVIAYSVQKQKTEYENANLVSGVGCMPESALADFGLTKKLFGKEDGRQFYYAVQSFEDGLDINPITAHQMAIELVERCYPNHQAVVATHTDTDNIHSHIIINSVNSENGKKINQNKNTIEQFRKINDEICLKYGVPVCKRENKSVKPMTGKEYYSAYNGESWKIELCIAINDAMEKSVSKDDFIKNLEQAGYKVDWADNHKYITFTTPKGKKCRDNKLHDEKYLKEVLEYEFKFRQEIVAGRIDINGEDIQRPSEAKAQSSSTGGTSSDADGKELDKPNSNNEPVSVKPKDIQYSNTKGSDKRRAEGLRTDISGNISAKILFDDRELERREGSNQRKADRCSGDYGNRFIKDKDGYQSELIENIGNDQIWQIGYWESERQLAFGYTVAEGQSTDSDNKAYFNPLDSEHYSGTDDIGRYNPASDIIGSTCQIIGGLDSIIESESDDPELRERQRRAKQNADAIAYGMEELAKLIEENKNSSTDYDEDDYDYEDDNQGWGPVMGGM